MVELSFKYPEIMEFPAQAGTRCYYGMFNRHGGVSSGLYATRNIGRGVGDQEAAVQANRKKVKEILGIPLLLSAKQVHGTGIYCLKDSLSNDLEIKEADGLITDLPGVGLMIQQADCQAVLLFDPVKEVIGAVHCGWRGSVLGILEKAIKAMTENYGTVPADLHAMISPSLGPCCGEFVNYRQELPQAFQQFMVRDNFFDFWQISRHQLVESGMVEERIGTAAICTSCSDDYYSYRRAVRQSRGMTGRNCSVIALKNG
jgi:YfiH family protein